MQKKVFIKNKYGEKLVGLIEYPKENKDKYPAILLVHGFHINKSEYGKFDRLAPILLNAGFVVFRFDFSGCGESEGDFSKKNITDHSKELKLMLDYVKGDPKTQNEGVGILAQSYGNAISLVLNPDVKVLVLVCPAINPLETLKKLMHHYDPKGTSWRKRSSGITTKVRPDFWKELSKYNFSELASRIKASIIFLYGKQDDKIPFSDVKKVYEASVEPKELVVIDGVDHDWEPNPEKVHQAALKGFNKYL